MIINRWNYETREYDATPRPAEWNIPLYSEQMDLLINCVNCGKVIELGNGYTSQEWHNHAGLGYSVCESCHEVESKTRREHEND